MQGLVPPKILRRMLVGMHTDEWCTETIRAFLRRPEPQPTSPAKREIKRVSESKRENKYFLKLCIEVVKTQLDPAGFEKLHQNGPEIFPLCSLPDYSGIGLAHHR